MTRTIHSSPGPVGHRVGAGRLGEPDNRAIFAPRASVSYICCNGHATACNFAATVKVPPSTWTCPKCGQPAGQDPKSPPPPERYRLSKTQDKTHLEYVYQRRSPEQAAEILAWGLTRCHAAREQCTKAVRRDVAILGLTASATLPSALLVGGIRSAGAVIEPGFHPRAASLRPAPGVDEGCAAKVVRTSTA